MALADRKLQQSVLASLRYLIPDIDRVQQMRNVVPYAFPTAPAPLPQRSSTPVRSTAPSSRPG